MRAGRLAIALLLGLAALLGWTAPTSSARKSTPPAARMSDAELEKAIRERLARSKIAADRFTVRVQGGVAILEGRTGIVQHKGTATRLAKAAGARKVVNRIEVSEEARLKASQNLAQGRRRAQIKRSESHPRSEPR
ncbi:MAG: BON domain-containing protein [Bryobacteraceae bacterium]